MKHLMQPTGMPLLQFLNKSRFVGFLGFLGSNDLRVVVIKGERSMDVGQGDRWQLLNNLLW